MNRPPIGPESVENLHRVLTAHLKSLEAARCDESLVAVYSRLLRRLRDTHYDLLNTSTNRPHGPAESLTSRQELEYLLSLPLTEIENMIEDESVPRRILEALAIERFGVPRGSMRSLSNRAILVDKLRILVRNERAHKTIREVAKHYDH